MKLTEEQKYVIKEVSKLQKKVYKIGGLAGTGKSVLVRNLIELFPNFAACAYTGKATNVLRKKGIYDATTIHSLIYKAYEDENKNVYFSLAGSIDCDGIIVDEASMVSEDIYRDLLSFGKPVIFVGDHGQLEPIGDKFNLMQEPDFTLEEIHRNAGEIAHFAEYIRKGYKASAWHHRSGSSDKIKFLSKNNYQEAVDQVDQIICAFNKTRVENNILVRQKKEMNPNFPQIGDRIICLRNNSLKGLFNGMQGTIGWFHKKNLIHFVSDDHCVDVSIDPNVFNQVKYEFDFGTESPNPFDYSYAITCHKCVHPDTLVETEEGLLPISKIKKEGIIATPNGNKNYKNFVSNPRSPSLKITTEDGYEIIVTCDHKIEIWDGEKYKLIQAKHAQKNQFLRMKLGLNLDVDNYCKLHKPQRLRSNEKKYKVPNYVTNEFAEFLGLMVADGTIFRSGFRLAKRHDDVLKRFYELCKNLFECEPKKITIQGTNGYEISSSFLSRWLSEIDGLLPNKKDIPECILRSSLIIQNFFIRGLFEDGTVNMKNNKVDHIEFYSKNISLIKKLKVMLLRNEIISGCTKNRPEALYIYGSSCEMFRKNIGFISSFKNNRLNFCKKTDRYYRIPISKKECDSLNSIYTQRNSKHTGYISRRNAEKNKNLDFLFDRLNYHHVRIVEIKEVLEESMCVEVPDGNLFFQNGFPFSNSQGDQFDKILVLEQKCDLWSHPRWAYTAASRAVDKIYWCS